MSIVAIPAARCPFLNGKLDDGAGKLDATGELQAKRTAVSSASVFELLTSIDGSVIDGERVVTGTRLDAKNIDDVFQPRARQYQHEGRPESQGYPVKVVRLQLALDASNQSVASRVVEGEEVVNAVG